MNQNSEMTRTLGFIPVLSLVIGTILGTGVFLKAAIMSQYLGNSMWVLIAYVVAGLLSLAGALTYAEIGILFPRAGGEYVYLKEAFGEMPAYLYGWQRFWVSAPGTIAAYAVGTATFAAPILNLDWMGGQKGFAVILIIVFSCLNCLNVQLNGRLASVMTFLKVAMLVFIIGGVIFLSKSGTQENLMASGTAFPGFSAFGAALLAALWAYDGWNNMPMVAGEIKNPSRNIPWGLGLGVLVILGLYALIHYCYFYALPFNEVLTANSKVNPQALPVAAKVAQSFMGPAGVLFLGIAMMFSAIGAMNASILTNARVPYAMAKDGLFATSMAKLHPKTESPYVAILVQAVFSVILAMSGSFDQLTDYVVFASWIFYALVTASVFKFRKTMPDAPRSYKTWGYPVVPVVFLILAVLLLINTLWTSPQESMWGLVIIMAGAPVYYIQKKYFTVLPQRATE
ncbi:amino acid permease [Bdellovibrio sp. ZAP7]|uniref:APC family permease n=1 Tax=Bdellovibrio sp. ZAP7 TaxID=2231053 RepID=UPI00115B930C|nr:amino acid permease [Bdellovibrio sp. ZAP7]QDK46173.1 amino acid permease [Bdellovibrio sp. ZAP7]